MQASLEKWVDKLQYVKLPALPGTTRALVRLRTNKDISMNELAVVIEKDPGLTLNLLRTINGLKHRHLASEVTTVEHALMMLGLKGLTSFSAS
ncbi:MAG: HDOD domain-containing protein, partial [Gammaproteobacteria bacterium]|nr:HDOD domain-containing protein [Gammaproteobacteria bacterium]